MGFQKNRPRIRGRGHLPTVFFFVLAASVVAVSGISLLNAVEWVDRPFAGFLVYQFPDVGSMGLKDWAGSAAGLNYMDRVVSVDGRTVEKGQDITAYVSTLQPGTLVHYRVVSDHSTKTITLPVTIFTVRDFFYVFLIPFAGGLALFVLGVAVYVMKPNTPPSWVFSVLCFSLGSYMVTGFEMQSSYLFERFHFIICTLFPATFLHLGLIFPDRSRRLARLPYVEYLVYLPVVIMIVAYQIYLSRFPAAPDPGQIPWILRYENIATADLYYTFFCVAGLIALVFQSMRTAATDLARQRAKVILFGVTSFFPAILVELGDFHLKIGLPLNFLTFLVFLFPLSVAYAIVKHNLFDADRMIRMTVGYTVVSAVIVGAYCLLSVSFSVALGRWGLVSYRVFPVIFALCVILIFNPLKDRVQALVDRVFFRKELDYNGIVDSFGGITASSLDRGYILRQLAAICTGEMSITSISVFLLDPSRRVYERQLSEGSGIDHGRGDTLARREPVLTIIEEEKREIADYEIPENPNYKDRSDQYVRVFEILGANFLFPIMFHGEVIGLMALGRKKSGRPYSEDDINLIRTLAQQTAVAIENISLTERIKNEENVRTSLARYLSPQIVDQIISQDVQVNLSGRRMEVTVLFSDIRNFTAISEQLPPDQLVALLNEYFTEMAGRIFDHHGSLDKYIGDAMVAVFGSLIPLQNHAESALRAAVNMMRHLELLNRKWAGDYGLTVGVGVGINTGDVFLGNVGSQERMEFTVLGDAVNVASRFSVLARPGEILISDQTLARLDGNPRVVELPAIKLKGKTEKVKVFSFLYNQ